ncbi:hypothetical protein [Sabulicella glaciei]|uniref:Uncharacterized protein n=1 Tax=Sabulicella glaciei TaxID=2984948 RepID=A0ABT3NZI6_9PROT|nr:hypothetical protein [Roseococcus sp. MDT2-1-1]MCW8087541.1 hypothetical protein [Roseococcus sp. MDT2-1-1]
MGDRMVFGQNDRNGAKVANVAKGLAEAGVSNGAHGTVTAIEQGKDGPTFRVKLDGGGRIGRTRLVANPRGYVGHEPNLAFRPDLVAEL